MNKLKIVHFSDTHGGHRNVKIPDGDILVFSGDMSNSGSFMETEMFIDWFSKLPHVYKILVPGNHDRSLDPKKSIEMDSGFWNTNILDDYLKHDSLNYMLVNQGCNIEGITFWGSPYSPTINEGNKYWGFSEDRKPLSKRWLEIPRKLDVLITHGPAYGKLDNTFSNENVGCEFLRWHIKDKKPKVHLFGHIHESYGMETNDGTLYLNSSVVNKNLMLVNKPQCFNIDIDTKEVDYCYNL